LAWNRWIAAGISAEEREFLVSTGFPAAELKPLLKDEKQEFLRAFRSRTGRDTATPPEPTQDYDFSNTEFDRPVSFDGFLFTREVSFIWSRFSKDATFDRARFFAFADFDWVTFSRTAAFYLATFSGTGSFIHATFEHAVFHSSTFDVGNLEFAEFNGLAVFSWATFNRLADFRRATFLSGLIFRNTKFAGSTIFSETRFKNNVPDFRGATMHEATEWNDSIWPRAPREKDSAQYHVHRYERLKLEMERLKKHEDEQRFFRRELRARRALARPG
jgi:uncharacterized protein YjbI with pentapeptide repeats